MSHSHQSFTQLDNLLHIPPVATARPHLFRGTLLHVNGQEERELGN